MFTKCSLVNAHDDGYSVFLSKAVSALVYHKSNRWQLSPPVDSGRRFSQSLRSNLELTQCNPEIAHWSIDYLEQLAAKWFNTIWNCWEHDGQWKFRSDDQVVLPVLWSIKPRAVWRFWSGFQMVGCKLCLVANTNFDHQKLLQPLIIETLRNYQSERWWLIVWAPSSTMVIVNHSTSWLK